MFFPQVFSFTFSDSHSVDDFYSNIVRIVISISDGFSCFLFSLSEDGSNNRKVGRNSVKKGLNDHRFARRKCLFFSLVPKTNGRIISIKNKIWQKATLRHCRNQTVKQIISRRCHIFEKSRNFFVSFSLSSNNASADVSVPILLFRPFGIKMCFNCASTFLVILFRSRSQD